MDSIIFSLTLNDLDIIGKSYAIFESYVRPEVSNYAENFYQRSFPESMSE